MIKFSVSTFNVTAKEVFSKFDYKINVYTKINSWNEGFFHYLYKNLYIGFTHIKITLNFINNLLFAKILKKGNFFLINNLKF
jgi:hypothetical protein